MAEPGATPAQLAKAALRRLAVDKLEPTPDNYLRAYQAEAGEPIAPPPVPAAEPARSTDVPTVDPAEEGRSWAELIKLVLRGVERSNKLWTSARRKDSVQRVLSGSQSHPERLQRRLRQLVGSWDGDSPDATVERPEQDVVDGDTTEKLGTPAHAHGGPEAAQLSTAPWASAMSALSRTVETALPEQDAQAEEIGAKLLRLTESAATPDVWSGPGGTETVEAFRSICEQAQQVLRHRHHLMAQLGSLCHELTDSLSDLAEDDSWVKGQCEVMRAQLEDGLHARGVRHVSQVLFETRMRQHQLRRERDEARQSLKQLLHQMLHEIAELGGHTDRFQTSLGRYADTIGRADSLASLAGAVREMVEESHAVQTLVSEAQSRLQTEHAKAAALTLRVRELEDEIRKLSDEVSTDPLTQIANRRGLMRAFEVERSRTERSGQPLSIGLLDVDNFKRLNDQLGHQTGDEALKFLTEQVKAALRPCDTLARYGGEEFVVLLPDTTLEDAQTALTRLQRKVSAELFLKQDDEQQVFITFSAGVSLHRADEPIEAALDRADVALYEAKRTGKNRTCVA